MRYLIVLFFIFFFSCSQKKEYDFEIVRTDSISMPISNKVSTSSPSVYFIDDNIPKFLFQNRDVESNSNEILYFDLKNKKLVKRLIFSENNGYYKSIHGFIPINKDSLILSNGLTDSLYVSDINGKILFKKYFKFGNEKDYISQIVSSTSHPIGYVKNNIYFSNSRWQEKKNDFSRQNFIFSYNIKKDTLEKLNVFYPEDYIKSNFFSNEYFHCFDNKNIVISPMNSHEIWIVNLESERLIKKEVKSDYFREFLKFSAEPAKDMQESMYNNAYYSQYVNIVYDKYRKVYYRFFYPGIDIDKKDKNLKNEYYHPRKMSIIVLDENFNKIGEQLFSNYDFKTDYFIAPDGLYINSNNELNKNFEEDKLKYTRLSLVKNEE